MYWGTAHSVICASQRSYVPMPLDVSLTQLLDCIQVDSSRMCYPACGCCRKVCLRARLARDSCSNAHAPCCTYVCGCALCCCAASSETEDQPGHIETWALMYCMAIMISCCVAGCVRSSALIELGRDTTTSDGDSLA